MTIQFDATFRDGAIHPAQPLQLPENTPVHVVVTPKIAGQPMTSEAVLAIPPKSPRNTPEEFDAIIEKYSISVPPLPEDFSRADIYSDHD
jgi:hypothetical protein